MSKEQEELIREFYKRFAELKVGKYDAAIDKAINGLASK